MSGDDDRQSELAREHKDRQAQRAAEQAAKARRNTFIGAGVAVAVVAGGIFAVTAMAGGGPAKTPVAAETSASATPSAPRAGDGHADAHEDRPGDLHVQAGHLGRADEVRRHAAQEAQPEAEEDDDHHQPW